MAAVLALVAAAFFGAGDQYLGSLSWHPWAADVSLLSAPWLVLAFLAGSTQRDSRRAMLLGLGCTAVAFAGYGMMTLSPIEHAQLNATTVAGFARSEAPAELGALLTGPLFGWFGYRWRTRRAWLGALVTSGAVVLEPVAHLYAGSAIRFRAVWLAEVAVGLALAAYFAAAATRRRVL